VIFQLLLFESVADNIERLSHSKRRATNVAKVLIVEDDADLSGRVAEWLTFEKHSVEQSFDGKDADEKLRFYKYELVVLDLNLPELSGLEVCRRFRSAGGMTPILILTGKDAIHEKEEGLDAGADDYLTKPFHMRELSARIRALLRRTDTNKGLQSVLRAGELSVDTVSHMVELAGQPVQLLPKEFAILEFFIRHPNEVFSPEALLDRVWESSSDSSVDTVYTTIKTLRKKLGSTILKTVHGLGYKMECS